MCKRMGGPTVGDGCGQLMLGMPRDPWWRGSGWAASPGLDLEAIPRTSLPPSWGRLPGAGRSTGRRPAFPGRRPRHTLTSREPVTDVL